MKWPQVIVSWLVLAVSLLPGLALTRILDGSADRVRKAMLAPALGLLLIFGVAGFGGLLGLELKVISILIFAINLYAIKELIPKNIEGQIRPWHKLELAMEGNIEADEYLESEAAAQTFFQENREKSLVVAIAFSLLVSLIPLALFSKPMGVDWIGFSVLTEAILVNGNLNLPNPSVGWWTYPPAFPTLAAWNSHITGVTSAQSVMALGQISFAALLIGIAGAADRHGAGAKTLLAVGLGAALFAKVYDSGYPTVASQLGLVVGLLVLLRPAASEHRHHLIGFIIAASCVALIHPTGAIYLCTLMIANIVIGRSIDGGEKWDKILNASAVILTIGAIISLIFIAPRVAKYAVLSEYGWQGGAPLLMYGGWLVPIGLWALFSLRKTVEGKILALWIGLNWILTFIHFAEGLQQIPLLTLLSYSLYSMALHAFHIPFAIAIGLWWSKSTSLSEIDGDGGGFLMLGRNPHPINKVGFAIFTIIILQISSALVVMVELSNHDELYAISEGDERIQSLLSDLPAGSIIYNENAHWGHILNMEQDIGITAIPSLGLLHQTQSVQNIITNAIIKNDITNLQLEGITHAVSSPMGVMGWYLASSPWWELLADEDGSRLWELRGNLAVFSESVFIKIEGENMRPDPWENHRFNDPFNFGSNRLHLYSGTKNVIIDSTSDQMVCLVTEKIGDIEASFDGKIIQGSGWTQTCVQGGFSEYEIKVESKSHYWLNPLGLSGRGERIIDQTGLRIHWIELSVQVADLAQT